MGIHIGSELFSVVSMSQRTVVTSILLRMHEALAHVGTALVTELPSRLQPSAPGTKEPSNLILNVYSTSLARAADDEPCIYIFESRS